MKKRMKSWRRKKFLKVKMKKLKEKVGQSIHLIIKLISGN